MQINQFRVKLNHESIGRSFKIYTASNINYKSYWEFFNKIKDSSKEALAITYVKENRKAYILAKRDASIQDDNIHREELYNLGDLKDFILFKLLVYATTTIQDEEVIFDPDGLFYIVKSSKKVYETVMVNIKRGHENRIFFSLNAKNFIKTGRKSSKVKYQDKNGILVRLKKGEKPKSYFVKQGEDDLKYDSSLKRSHIDFLKTDIRTVKGSKLHILVRFLREIRKNLKNYLSVNLEDLEFQDFELRGTRNKRDREIRSLIIQKLSMEKDGLVIEDFIKDNRSQKFIDEVEEIIKNIYNSTVTRKKIKSSKSQFNLFITENMKSKNDPYKDIKRYKKPTQNILLENLENTKTILPVLLKELVVKQDILNGKISIPTYQRAKNLTFYYFEKEKNSNDRYEIYRMVLDGQSINFNRVEYRKSLFEDFDERRYIEEMLLEVNRGGVQAELIVKSADGDVNIITKTEYFPIPNIETFIGECHELSKPLCISYERLVGLKDDVPEDREKEYLEFLESVKDMDKIDLKMVKSGRKVKNYISKRLNLDSRKTLNKSKKGYLSSLIGIKYFKLSEKEAYYVVGTREIQKSFTRANSIRNIKAIEGKLLLDELLVMMDEYFVKNMELTVLPYPIKYLREFKQIERRET